MRRREIVSAIDRRAYWSYVHVCLSAQVSPMSALEWMASTEKGVEWHWKRWALWLKLKRDKRVSDLPLDPRKETPEWVALGFHAVEIRRGGSFSWGVRRQTSAIGGRGHLLTLKTCKKCLELLPAFCFAKQLKGRRSACKWCDNTARVERRRTRKTA